MIDKVNDEVPELQPIGVVCLEERKHKPGADKVIDKVIDEVPELQPIRVVCLEVKEKVPLLPSLGAARSAYSMGRVVRTAT